MYGVALYRCVRGHIRCTNHTIGGHRQQRKHRRRKKKIVCNARTVAEWRTVYVSIRFRLIEQHLKYCQYVRGVATGAESALISTFFGNYERTPAPASDNAFITEP